MLFRKQDTVRRKQNLKEIILIIMILAMIIGVSACSPTRGSILILENVDGRGFTMDFKEWTSKDKGQIALDKGDVLQIEVAREAGVIGLVIRGKKGSEPYRGNDLRSGMFTVTVSEGDEYAIEITGKNASGRVKIEIIQNYNFT